MKIMVTGGAGYIGSVVTEELIAAGHDVTVYDNLSSGHRDAVVPAARLIEADLHDRSALRRTLSSRGIEAVVHMAASSAVGESVADPAKYYHNNVVAGLALLDAMRAEGVRRMVFSSSAAVYGEPARQPIDEGAATSPTSPYGETKLALENALRWYDRAYGMRHVCLRYFNAAGASSRNGERHEPETHLIPLVLGAALGLRGEVTIFGDDYPTRDGTCVRDYIHVLDLARAHCLALDSLAGERGPSRVYNVGCGGEGYTVREVIDIAAEISGRPIPVRVAARRPGDPAVLVASSALLQRELGFRPERQDLRAILASAWQWLAASPQRRLAA